ncbi:alpha/beta hydrolase fold domain-containing protein [Microbacterium arabinogalactanolyticum]|uniref:alpha/beta hydrolase fold domain-containing protein n=1 Tax=Microbacterium arabinogalactanolyticum TaxID=69365 RepID=UPI002552EFDD|nr:alpha/beta hydrolase fold domain-containing protein [Microbacterium arabinogalactanolyticum]GLC85827.1 alpha/beta hydrolase [Microbacterium arabinogalactanolyticum]
MTEQDAPGAALAPEIRAWAQRVGEMAAGLPVSDAEEGFAPRRLAARMLSDVLAEEFALPVPDGVRISELPLRGGDGVLRARRFRSASARGPQPTMLWCHGGGFFGGTIDEILNDRISAALALASGVQIFSLEYRLAPEHPFPAPVDDAVEALRDLRARWIELEVAPDRLGVGGNSAGATIAATAARWLCAEGEQVHHQALEVLPAALYPYGDSATRYGRGFGLDDVADLADVYRGGAPLTEASPLDAPDLRGLPPALLLVAEFDPLRDGALAYAERLRAVDVPVTVHVGAGHVHGSPGLTAGWQGARDWQDAFAAGLALAYHP